MGYQYSLTDYIEHSKEFMKMAAKFTIVAVLTLATMVQSVPRALNNVKPIKVAKEDWVVNRSSEDHWTCTNECISTINNECKETAKEKKNGDKCDCQAMSDERFQAILTDCKPMKTEEEGEHLLCEYVPQDGCSSDGHDYLEWCIMTQNRAPPCNLE